MLGEHGTVSRRSLLAGGALAMAWPVAGQAALPVPAARRIGFRMLRNGAVIGSHQLDFTPQGDTLVVSVAIEILVRMIGIPVYRYSHRATERWRGDRFMGIETSTDRDGSPRVMRAVRGEDGVMRVTGTRTEPYVAPEGVLPTTYWNKAMVQPRLINSEDGRLMDLPLSEGGLEPVRTAQGATLPARRFHYGGELDLTLWYDGAGQWAHLEFTSEGSTIIYEKL